MGTALFKQLNSIPPESPTEKPDPEWFWVIALHTKLCKHPPSQCHMCGLVYYGKKPERKEGDGSIKG